MSPAHLTGLRFSPLERKSCITCAAALGGIRELVLPCFARFEQRRKQHQAMACHQGTLSWIQPHLRCVHERNSSVDSCTVVSATPCSIGSPGKLTGHGWSRVSKKRCKNWIRNLEHTALSKHFKANMWKTCHPFVSLWPKHLCLFWMAPYGTARHGAAPGRRRPIGSKSNRTHGSPARASPSTVARSGRVKVVPWRTRRGQGRSPVRPVDGWCSGTRCPNPHGRRVHGREEALLNTTAVSFQMVFAC